MSSFFGQLDRHVLDDLAEAQVGGGHRELVLRGQERVEDVRLAQRRLLEQADEVVFESLTQNVKFKTKVN